MEKDDLLLLDEYPDLATPTMSCVLEPLNDTFVNDFFQDLESDIINNDPFLPPSESSCSPKSDTSSNQRTSLSEDSSGFISNSSDVLVEFDDHQYSRLPNMEVQIIEEDEAYMENGSDDSYEDISYEIPKKMNYSSTKFDSLPTTVTSELPKLKLTDEERRLLKQEGYRLPENMPLTKMEERVLKKVRRKIRNKKSAQESRRKRKNYMESLEIRVEQCTKANSDLQRKIDILEEQNLTLLQQLQKVQSMITSVAPKSKSRTMQATGTCLMVLMLSFCLFIWPSHNPFMTSQLEPERVSYNKHAASIDFPSRTLFSKDISAVESPPDVALAEDVNFTDAPLHSPNIENNLKSKDL